MRASDGLSYNLYTPSDNGTGTASVRSVGIYSGQLYYSSGSSSFGSNKGVSALGIGVTVPAADGKLAPKTVINGGINESVTDFVFLDTDNNGASDLNYQIRNGGIHKLLFDGTSWLDKGTISGDFKSHYGPLLSQQRCSASGCVRRLGRWEHVQGH